MKAMSILIPDIKEIIAEGNLEQLKEAVSGLYPADIAEVFEGLEPEERKVVFSVLDEDQKIAVFDELDEDDQYALLQEQSKRDQAFLLNEMSPDERADLFEELPDEEEERLLPLMKEEEQKDTKLLTAYPPTTAGGRMTTEFASVQESWSAGDAIDYVRRTAPDKETIYSIYVVSEKGTLIGFLSLKKLILSPSDKQIIDIMDEKVISVKADLDQEEVIQIIRKYDLLAVPVTDDYGKLVGIVTVDDIMDVIREEHTEDIYRMAAAGEHVGEYLETSSFTHGRQRIPWLITFLVAGFASGFIISAYDDVLEMALYLAFFIPILMGSAGNSGIQSSTTIVRGLATGEVSLKDYFKIFRKELFIGILVGGAVGILASMIALIWFSNIMLGVTLFLTILIAITASKTIGGLLPIITKKLGFDPALMSGPFITSIIDIISLIIYFNIARFLLRLF
jgi:magnesium transporter